MKKRSGKKESRNVRKVFVSVLLLVISITAFIFIFNKQNVVTADTSQQSICCERTTDGAWCLNSPPATCDTNYRESPTSCDSTSYCKLGTCVDSQEGTCLPNVPQEVCQNDGGVWIQGDPSTISQCQLGCCLVGDQAAYVTQTKCKSIGGAYGVNATFRTDIKDEVTCIASANPQVMGACVLDDGFTRKCRMLTRADCNSLQATSGSNTTVEFHEGLLCTADSLATNCARTKETTCLPNKDQVYFVDSCGNVANVYDASKVNDTSYWTNIQNPSVSCNFGSSNANSATCGNCDYLSGSLCKPYQRGNSQTTVQPQYGSNICADLSCNYNGKTYLQGESWCGNTEGADKNLPGSEYAVLSCFEGQVTTELCDAFRNKVCIQNSTQTSEGPFLSAACVVNRWQDCIAQTNQQDCENIDQRDCIWTTNQSILKDSNGNVFTLNSNGDLAQSGGGSEASCIPKYAPGFSFWNSTEDSSGGDAEAICAQASQNCIVKFTKGLLSSWKCSSNCACIGLKDGQSAPPGGISALSNWIGQRTNMCMALGDCGNSTNYIGIPGYQSNSTVEVTRVSG